MASKLVIVAIPASEDSVWNVSSEKTPHMTILFLGDAIENPNVSKIVSYVGDLTAKYLRPFNLRVDHRGTLGPDKADVLFFAKEIPWQVFDFRSMCLEDQSIRSAYNSIQQYPDWTPHLTLGYPETPAKPDSWDPMGAQYVQFDKIAVWFGDSEGQEFQLIENHPKAVDRDAAWAAGEINVLKHHGVKGMRWGVRRKNVGGPNEVTVSVNKNKLSKKRIKTSGGKGHAPTEEAVSSRIAAQKAKKSGVESLSNEEIQKAVQRMNLETSFKQAAVKQDRSPVKKFVAELLVNAGKQQAQRVANDQMSKAVDKALSEQRKKKAAA